MLPERIVIPKGSLSQEGLPSYIEQTEEGFVIHLKDRGPAAGGQGRMAETRDGSWVTVGVSPDTPYSLVFLVRMGPDRGKFELEKHWRHELRFGEDGLAKVYRDRLF